MSHVKILSRPARSARRWARRPAASSTGPRRSSTSSASARGRRSSRTRFRPPSPAGSLEAFRMLMEDPSPVAKLRSNAPTSGRRSRTRDSRSRTGSTRSCPSSSATRRRRSRCRHALFDRGRLRLRVRLPRRPAGPRAPALPGLGRPLGRRPPRGRRRFRRRRQGVRGRLERRTTPTARRSRGSGPARTGNETRPAAGRTARRTSPPSARPRPSPSCPTRSRSRSSRASPSFVMTAWTTVFFPTGGISAAGGDIHFAATFSKVFFW